MAPSSLNHSPPEHQPASFRMHVPRKKPQWKRASQHRDLLFAAQGGRHSSSCQAARNPKSGLSLAPLVAHHPWFHLQSLARVQSKAASEKVSGRVHRRLSMPRIRAPRTRGNQP